MPNIYLKHDSPDINLANDIAIDLEGHKTKFPTPTERGHVLSTDYATPAQLSAETLARQQADADLRTDVDKKLEASDVNSFFKDVDSTVPGIFKFTRHDNTTVEVGHDISGTFIDSFYDPDTIEMVFVRKDETEIRVPVSAFISIFEGEDTVTIQMSVSADNKISANIKGGSITLNLLHQEVLDELNDKLTQEQANLLYDPLGSAKAVQDDLDTHKQEQGEINDTTEKAIEDLGADFEEHKTSQTPQHKAEQIVFDDGDTFQDKFDDGSLKGLSPYELAVQDGFVGTVTEWLESLVGETGTTPTIGANGNWFIGEDDTGEPSQGVTPHIGENGNWFIGETDTGKPSVGVGGTGAYLDENGNPITDAFDYVQFPNGEAEVLDVDDKKVLKIETLDIVFGEPPSEPMPDEPPVVDEETVKNLIEKHNTDADTDTHADIRKLISEKNGQSTWFGTSPTAAATTAKVVTLQGDATAFKRDIGVIVAVRLTTANTATTPTLNVNGTGAGTIRYNGLAVTGTRLNAGDHMFQWDGAYWNWLNYPSTILTVNATLSTTWTGTSAPYTQAVTITGVTATSKVEFTSSGSQDLAFFNAGLLGTGALNSITFRAIGTKPTVAIPVTIVITGV